MRCRSCDYPLWNLTARQCPECGAAFAPSEFEFTAHTVAYCCPHCDQPYYGTSGLGHLEPVEFECVSCDTHIHMDEMVLRPTEGVAEQRTRMGDMPWFDREKRGRVKSWFSTIWMAMIQPVQLMRGVPEDSSAGAALWYALFTNLIFAAGRLAPVLCFMLIPLMVAGGGGGGGNTGLAAGKLLAMIGAGSVVGVGAMLVIIFVSIALWGLFCHAALKVTGDTAGGLRRTFHAICYASGANAISVVPCIGGLAVIWWIVSAVIMLREGQRVSGVRATFAVLAYPLTVFILIAGMYAVILGSVIGGASAAQAAATPQAEIATLGRQVIAYASLRDGAPPAHALDLVPENSSGTGLFISAATATAPEDVPVNEGNLRDFQLLGVNRQRAAAQLAADALPENVVAHRVGDFVFTWHGIDLDTADPGLWLVVASPDPGPNAGAGTPAVVFLVDGTTSLIHQPSMSGRLRRQNRLRADMGLAELPDPSSVTHENPAVGGE